MNVFSLEALPQPHFAPVHLVLVANGAEMAVYHDSPVRMQLITQPVFIRPETLSISVRIICQAFFFLKVGSQGRRLCQQKTETRAHPVSCWRAMKALSRDVGASHDFALWFPSQIYLPDICVHTCEDGSITQCFSSERLRHLLEARLFAPWQMALRGCSCKCQRVCHSGS